MARHGFGVQVVNPLLGQLEGPVAGRIVPRVVVEHPPVQVVQHLVPVAVFASVGLHQLGRLGEFCLAGQRVQAGVQLAVG